ncbi:hypothetical protein B9Z55_026980 [Caenorhabditis nigoni]|uniref:BTB domain-containing protein n=1 Tax=Caenorhabditis nigoni TaxID=1611254 RepID=A0A2G5SIW2_9PELO|nr:hypothetical protein B9Z55_026980 [Caenorhabditis nigoni]
MAETLTLGVYESTFAKTDKTDVILVVDGKKLHVNKAVLSYHSDYFNAMFNSNFKEKSMSKIEMKDVKIEDLAALLSLITVNPIWPKLENAERILELSDRFLMPSVRCVLEIFLVSSDLSKLEKMRLGDKFKLEKLLNNSFSQYKTGPDFQGIKRTSQFKGFSDSTKIMILDRLMAVLNL